MAEASDAFPPRSLQVLAESVAEILKARKESVAVAETAAGGLISATLLSIPGASQYYKGGLTVYTLPSRVAYAGWTEENIQGYKGPTKEVVATLAQNVRGTLKSTYVVSESGTAGPTGGPRPPGYVALAVAFEGHTETQELETGTNERAKNMVLFAEAALQLLLTVLRSK